MKKSECQDTYEYILTQVKATMRLSDMDIENDDEVLCILYKCYNRELTYQEAIDILVEKYTQKEK